MARPAFSVRFPADLADSLDRLAGYCGRSRSDLVEVLIKAVDEYAEGRDQILNTTVAGAPREKRNLRLSADALIRLKRLAGDLAPADFLRRMVAHVVATAPPGWRQESATGTNGHTPASSRTPQHTDDESVPAMDDEDQVEVAALRTGAAGLAVLGVLLIGALVTLIVWLIRRSAPSAFDPGQHPGGQPPDGPRQTDDA